MLGKKIHYRYILHPEKNPKSVNDQIQQSRRPFGFLGKTIHKDPNAS